MTTTAAPLVFVDTETTSLRHDRRPWEIAMIHREADGTETEHVIQIRDVDRSNADPAALKVGRFYERYNGDPEPWYARPEVTIDSYLRPWPAPRKAIGESAAAKLVEKVTRDAVIIGVNPSFDTATLEPMLIRHGLTPAWHYTPVDLKAMAAGWLRHRPDLLPAATALADAHVEIEKLQHRVDKLATSPAVRAPRQRHQAEHRLSFYRHRVDKIQRQQVEFLAPPWRSYELSAACGVEPPTDDEKHTALGDARWARRWYAALTGEVAS